MSLQNILNEKKADFERNADEFKKQAQDALHILVNWRTCYHS